MLSLSGMPSMARRLGEKTTAFSPDITNPGTERHAPATSVPSTTSAMARAITSTSISGAWGVGRRVWASTSPFGETTPAAILVPPTSTPTAFNGLPHVHYL